jgi:tRNA 2-(methylsulfanyl)-N6-isopentenyladenosine37 hydroxylase
MDPLRSVTDEAWLPVALAGFARVLVDHAHCERKAAASALSLVNDYSDCDELVRRLTRLAQEELRHFEAVHKELRARGLSLSRDRGDPYAKLLLRHVRHGQRERRTDRLLVCSLIEARSCERLGLLGQGLGGDLGRFYTRLATAEAGHHRLFVELASAYDEPGAVTQRLDELAEIEAEIVASLPIEPRIH